MNNTIEIEVYNTTTEVKNYINTIKIKNYKHIGNTIKALRNYIAEQFIYDIKNNKIRYYVFYCKDKFIIKETDLVNYD